jgi:hypothetical protein
MRAAVQQIPVQTPTPPPAKKVWWHISPQDLKSKVVYDLLKVGGGALITAAGGTQLLHQSLAKAPYIALMAIGFFLVVQAFLPSKRRKGQVSQQAAIGFLRADCALLLERYKELMFNHREASRLPLNSSSWPDFGSPFDYVAVSLCSNYRIFGAFLLKVHILWNDLQRTDEPTLFRVGENSRMDQVVDSLQEMDGILQQHQSPR